MVRDISTYTGPLEFILVFTGRRTFSSSSARQGDITLTVDGKEVTVPQGTP
jgi:hypothetical protein